MRQIHRRIRPFSATDILTRRPARLCLLLLGLATAVASGAPSAARAGLCDTDNDCDVDRGDIQLITGARNESALPGDPRDADGDGLITVNDARQCVLQCTRDRCAPVTNQAPSASVGPDQQVAAGDNVSLDGSGDDPNGTPVTLQWTLSAPVGSNAVLDDPTAATPAFTTDVPGLYSATLIARDCQLSSIPVTLTITAVQVNQAPVAAAGPDQAVRPGDAVTLDGSASSDPDDDPLTYSWSLESPAGSTAFLSDIGAVSPTFTPDLTGLYVATLIVNDGSDSSLPDSVTVSVNAVNTSPIAVDDTYGGALGSILEVPAPGILNNDSDAEGDPLTARLVSPPAQGTVELNPDGSFRYQSSVLGGALAENANLSVVSRPDVQASSQYSDSYAPLQAADGDLSTGWFTQRPPNNEFIELRWDSPVVGRQIRLFGDRTFGSQFDITSGIFQLFDAAGNLLYDSGDVLLEGPERDIELDLGEIENISRLRFSPTGFASANFDGGIAELELIGDGPYRIIRTRDIWAFTGGVDPFGEAISPRAAASAVVIDLDGDGDPETISSTYSNHLIAINGDGSYHFVVGGPAQPGSGVNYSTSVAVGDLDGDGLPEIAGIATNGQSIRVWEHDGTVKWDSGQLSRYLSFGALALADLNGDGSPEIIAGAGSASNGVVVLAADGSLFWQSAVGLGSGNNNYAAAIPIVADIDLDGSPEVLAGNTAYNADGSTKWHRADLNDGWNGVGNFDADPFPEIVLVSQGTVYLLEHDGQTKAISAETTTGRGGPPTIADFDSDGQPEIGVAGSNRYKVFETDLSLLWAQATIDGSSNTTGSAVFDFENDGATEVVYRDEQNLFVYDGRSGNILYETPVGSTTGIEAPIIADVDGDGAADIVVSSDRDATGRTSGIYAFTSEEGRWASTRPIWNQHSYHVTNINDDGSIPAIESANWLTPGLNHYRQNDLLNQALGSSDQFGYVVNDGFTDSNEAIVRIDLRPENTAPQIVSVPPLAGAVGARYVYGVVANDAESDTLSFSLSDQPTGMTIDPATGLIDWTPDAGQLGEHRVTAIVADEAGLTDLQTFVIVVADAPDLPPIADAGPDQTTETGSVVTLDGSGSSDPEGSPITYDWTLTTPAGSAATLSSTSIVNPSFTPDVAGNYAATLIVNDGETDSPPDTVAVTVSLANQPPTLAPVPDAVITVNTLLNVFLAGSDPESGLLTYSLDTAPAGMSVDPVTGVITWLPVAGQLGDNPVTARVTDDGDLFAVQSFNIEVTPLPNLPPELAPIAPISIQAGQALTVFTSATDPNPGDQLTFSLDSAPDGMAIDPATGEINWTPDNTNEGDNTVEVRVVDEGDLSDTTTFTVTVERVSIGDPVAPVANDDRYLVSYRDVLDVPAPGVLANDTDDNGDPLTAARTGQPDIGTLAQFAADGAFRYSPPPIPALQIGLSQQCSFRDLGVMGAAIAVGDIDGDGNIELVYGNPILDAPELVIVDGATCAAEVVPLGGGEDIGEPAFEATATLVNLDDDPDLEIVLPYGRFNPLVVHGDDPKYLMALNRDGSAVWSSPTRLSEAVSFSGESSQDLKAGPVPVDLDGDGSIELLQAWTAQGDGISGRIRAAVVAYDGATGDILWEYIGPLQRTQGTPIQPRNPIVADLDLDGQVEIVWNHSVLNPDGSLKFLLPVDNYFADIADFLVSAVANFDDDPYAEIIAYDRYSHYLFEHTGELKWKIAVRDVGVTASSLITVAQLDGDSAPEYLVLGPAGAAVNGNWTLYAHDTDGSVLWSQADLGLTIPFAKSIAVAPAAFDIDRDGIDELIVQHPGDTTGASPEAGLYVFSGTNGSILAQDATGLIPEFPGAPVTIADVDGDGAAEIIGTHVYPFGGGPELRVFEGLPGNPFPPARPIRNHTSYQPTHVNEDGSIPAYIKPHWLIPGLNKFFASPVIPGEHASTTTEFTYVANDGSEDSNEATVFITLADFNAPKIASLPQLFGAPDVLYSYPARATDADFGETFSWALADAPAGMTITADGLIEWTPTSADLSGNRVHLIVTDSGGYTDQQIFEIQVQGAVLVPDVVGLSLVNATDALNASALQVGNLTDAFSTTVAAGLVISQNPPAGAEVANDSPVDLVVSVGPGPEDTDDDGDGFTENQGDCNDADAGINPDAVEINGDGIDQNCDGEDGVDPLAEVIVLPESATLIVGQSLALTATGVFPDQTSQDLTGSVMWSIGGSVFDATVPGVFTVEAASGGITGSAEITVVAAASGDNTLPTAALTAPAANAAVTDRVDVLGTADDANFLKYTLAYAPSGSNDFTVFAEGTNPVVGGVLGQFDPTMLINDTYTIRLTVFDAGANQVSVDRAVTVAENLKVGNFSLSFTDLAIPMSGIPITVTRTYDSREKRKGDFGIGWKLDVDTLRISSNRELGTGWQTVSSGFFGVALQATDQHYVTLTLPDGRVERFNMAPTPTSSGFGPFPPSTIRVNFTPAAGTLGTLVSLDNNFITIADNQPGPATLLDDTTFDTYDPQRFRYTGPDGSVIVLHKQSGVESLTDPNGNTLTFDSTGIIHSGGKSILFERDSDGRISKLTDPRGNEQLYSYDANGDLVAHTDAAGNITSLKYNRTHGLIEILDPLGNRAIRNEYDDDGRLIAVVDALGNRVEYTRDIDGREELVTDPQGNTTRYLYDDRGNVLSEERTVTIEGVPTIARKLFEYDADNNEIVRVDPDGIRTELSYNARGNVLETIVDPGGLNITTSATYDADGNVLTETDALGGVTVYTYDGRGNPLTITDPAGHVQSFVYDAQGRVTSRTDAVGTRAETSFNADGQPVEQQIFDAGNQLLQRTTYAYDANGNRTGKTEWVEEGGLQVGKTTTFTYDANNRKVTETDPLGHTTTFEYNAAGQMVAVVDPLGQRTESTYDARGKLIRRDYEDGTAETWAYDVNGNQIQHTDQLGRNRTIGYDELKRQVAQTDPLGNSQRTVYSPAGRVVASINANGHRTDYGFDAAGRQISTTSPSVRDASAGGFVRPTETLTLDAAGRTLASTDANGGATTYTYDVIGRLLQTTLPDGETTQSSYDALGRLLSFTDELGRTTTNVYDGLGRLIQVTQPKPTPTDSAPVTTYTYDLRGNLTSQTDPLGNTTTFEYDGANRRVAKVLPSGLRAEVTYNAVGKTLTQTSFAGDVTAFDYDAMNRLSSQTYADGAVQSYDYFGNGLLRSVSNGDGTRAHTYDAANRLISIENADGSVIDYSYDAEGNQLSVSGGNHNVSYQYDALNRQSAVTSGGSTTTYGYDPVGNQVEVVFGNGLTTTRTFDVRSRVLDIEQRDGNGTLIGRFSNTYLANGRRESITELDGSIVSYDYDDLNRLTSEIRTGTNPRTVLYAYDLAGNRTGITRNGAVESAIFDEDGRLLSQGARNYSYDSDGNRLTETGGGRTVTYAWDARGRLASATVDGQITTYRYDAGGQRIEKRVGATSERYLVDGLSPTGVSQVHTRTNDGGSVREFVYGTGLVGFDEGSETFVQTDAHGNTRLLTDDSSVKVGEYDYEAYGEITQESGPVTTERTYAGEQLDPETGLFYLRARYYDPITGSFISRDPYEGDLENPISIQPYPYAASDPANLTDPTGQFTLVEINLSQALSNTLKAVKAGFNICKAKKAVDNARAVVWLAQLGLATAVQGNTFLGKVDSKFAWEFPVSSVFRPLEKVTFEGKPGEYKLAFDFEGGSGRTVAGIAKFNDGKFESFTGELSSASEIELAELTFCAVPLGGLSAKIETADRLGTGRGPGEDFGSLGSFPGGSINVNTELKGFLELKVGSLVSELAFLDVLIAGRNSKLNIFGWQLPPRK